MTAWAVDTASEDLFESNATQSILDEEIDTVVKETTNEFKRPIGNKKIAKKFLAAMGGVAASSFIIFFLLTLYNKVREEYIQPSKNFDNDSSLETPNNLLYAVKSFLNKTKW